MGVQPPSQEFASSTWKRLPEPESVHTSSNQDPSPRRNNQLKKNSSSNQNGESVPPSQPRRRFLPQPIETSSRSSSAPQTSSTSSSVINKNNHPSNSSQTSNSSHGNKMETNGIQPRRRILPQPIETTTLSRPGSSRPQRPRPPPQTLHSTISTPRRFKPNLIETDSRSVKGKTIDPSYSADPREFPVDSSGPSARPSPRRNTSPHLAESNFSYVSLLRRQETRRHSFRVPSLPRIPSVSSEDSEEPSTMSLSSSPPTQHPQRNDIAKPTTSMQDNCNENLSEYLLSVAARSAQNELKDQALAAFPNEQVYEPVDHFAIDEEEGDSEDQSSMYPQPHHLKSRRQSSADLSWELDYMRQHKEEAEQRLRAMVTSNTRKNAPNDNLSTPKPRGPSPPMLGADIVLPWSSSPEGTLCDHTHTENSAQPADPCTGCGGLWCATSQGDGGRGAGLWMGTCHKTEGQGQEPHVFSGIMTPMIQDSEIESDPTAGHSGSKPPAGAKNLGLNLDLSKATSDEFNDGFVTQIYNYVSLGYPCVARYYDYELSRISGISVEELRQDDLRTDAKGYVVAPDDDQAVACMRWKALRLYIREWVRQQPNMAEDETGLEAWGMPERKGSWAI